VSRALQLTLGLLTAVGGFVDVAAIATSAESGAKFGLGLVWAMLLGTLAIILLVEMSGRYAAVAKEAYAGGVRRHLGFKFAMMPLSACFVSNSLMLAAEMGGMAVALSLLLGVRWFLLYPLVAVFVFACVWLMSFKLVENLPSLLGLSTLAFAVAVVAMRGPGPALLTTLWRPQLHGDLAEYLFLAAAILGAIISPYLVVFYSGGAREEGWSRASLGLNRLTAVVGMSFGSVAAIGIVVLSAMTLRPLGIEVGTLGEVGITLARSFGAVGAYVFAVALFTACWGASLEIVLAMSYNVSQSFGWRWGLDRRHRDAARFRLVMLAFLVIAFLVGMTGADPLALTIYASALTAVVLPFALVPFLVLMNDPTVLRDNVNGLATNVATLAVVLVAFVLAVVSIPLLIAPGGGG